MTYKRVGYISLRGLVELNFAFRIAKVPLTTCIVLIVKTIVQTIPDLNDILLYNEIFRET